MKFCTVGTAEALDSDERDIPREETECVPLWVPDVLMAEPPDVAEIWQVFVEKVQLLKKLYSHQLELLMEKSCQMVGPFWDLRLEESPS